MTQTQFNSPQLKTTGKKMTQDQLISSLKTAASIDPVLKDVCHVWSIRERARNEQSLQALSTMMNREGFNYSQNQYIATLKSLAAMGLGKIDNGPGGKFRALKDIPFTLQTIGMAAVGKVESLQSLKTVKRNKRLPKLTIPDGDSNDGGSEPMQRAAMPPSQNNTFVQRRYVVPVAMKQGVVEIDLPRALTTKELGDLLVLLFDSKQD